MLAVGDVLDGRYEILAPLAEGGMGAVYLARRVLLGDDVAIKVILADAEGPAPLERFVRESRACAQLRHPNIVSILDYNADDPQRPFLVMELLSGPSLKDELDERGRFPVEELQRIIPPVCSALALAHSRGIVHRDLKPANIVAHDFGDGRVHKLVDFGVASVRQQGQNRLTNSQQFIGTVAYAPPEQLTGGEVDARSDVYSMGAVIFELATGRLPFEASEPMAVVAAHLNRPAPLPSSVCPGLPVWLDVAVGRALAKNRQDRWPDMASLARAMAPQETLRVTEYSPRGTGGSGLLATYEVGEPLGPGRLGSTVHKGTHRALGHPVAIRILRGSGERDAAARARFLHEARALQVAHPSIIQVRDYGEEGDLVYVVTDYIEGPSMRQLLTECGALPWPRLSRFVAQLLEAAHVLHRRKGLLCGLSPDIIRIATDDDGERIMISSAGIWDAQDLLGTLHDQTLRGVALADVELRYVAPELFTGRKADVRSDVFTLGVLAYEMATGTTPFDGATLPELLGKMLSGTARDPRELQPTLPERAAAAIQVALSTAPERRHASAREFASAFGESEQRG